MSEKDAGGERAAHLSSISGRTKLISTARVANAEVTSNSSTIRALRRMEADSAMTFNKSGSEVGRGGQSIRCALLREARQRLPSLRC